MKQIFTNKIFSNKCFFTAEIRKQDLFPYILGPKSCQLSQNV